MPLIMMYRKLSQLYGKRNLLFIQKVQSIHAIDEVEHGNVSK